MITNNIIITITKLGITHNTELMNVHTGCYQISDFDHQKTYFDGTSKCAHS